MKVSSLTAEGGQSYDLKKAVEIGIPIQRSNSTSSFGIAGAEYTDYEDGNFVGNVNRGGPCNLETIRFTAHGNGTHTECVGHVSTQVYRVNDCISDDFYEALLISLPSIEQGNGLYLDFSKFDKSLWSREWKALIIRSLPNSSSKINRDYSGVETPCIAPEDMKMLVELGVEHLLLDLPSVDPEWDNGALKSHHIFWNTPGEIRKQASITEFIWIDDSIKDGQYLLKINIAPFQSDAAPSRPVLYPLFT